MGKYIIDAVKKILAILLIVSFVTSLTVTTVSAKSQQSYGKVQQCEKVQQSKTQQAPNANFGATFPTIQFTDLSTARPGRTITSWSWDFGDGTTSNEKNPKHTYFDKLCTHKVTLQVVDNANEISSPTSFIINT